jgi:hypothetical protein
MSFELSWNKTRVVLSLLRLELFCVLLHVAVPLREWLISGEEECLMSHETDVYCE